LLTEVLTLESLGWSDELAAALEQHEDGVVPARVAVQHRIDYVVHTEQGEIRADLPGKLRHDAGWRTGMLPAVGDWVAVRLRDGGERATIVGVLPRRSVFSRKTAWAATEEQVVAANVDTVFLVAGIDRDLDRMHATARRLERYLTLAWESGAQPVVVLTKVDLAEDAAAAVAVVESITFGVPVHAISNLTGEGVDELTQYLGVGRTIALLGSSGVGKSTLVNRLAGREVLVTQAVREDGIGRHTTTHRELVVLPTGGLLLDTPGMRELQLWDGSDGIAASFADVEELATRCRFADCAHDSEPGCAVRAAIDAGTLAADRLESYEKLQRELAALARKQDKRAAAEERKRWKGVQQALRKDKY
jgi:ribosome biogenesis GTPase